VELHVRPGEPVRAGQSVMTLHTDEEARFARAYEALEGGWAIGPVDDPSSRFPLVLDRVAA
jgi:thymidine phosphorylase